MEAHTQKFLLVALAVAGAGWLLAVVGEATDHWIEKSTAGLFDCGNVDCPDWQEATQAMTIMGILAASAGIILVVVHLVLKGSMPWMPTAGGIACLVGGVFIIIGIIIYGAETEDIRDFYSLDLDWSFALVTVGGILFLVAGGLVMAKGRGD